MWSNVGVAISDKYIEIDDEIYRRLCAYREQLELGPNRLFRYMHYCDLIPDNSTLSVGRIESWYTRNAKSAIEDDINAVLTAFETICDETGITTQTNPRQLIALSESYQTELANQIGQYRSFTLKPWLSHPECPKGINMTFLKRIAEMKVKTLYAEQLKFLQNQIHRLQQS